MLYMLCIFLYVEWFSKKEPGLGALVCTFVSACVYVCLRVSMSICTCVFDCACENVSYVCFVCMYAYMYGMFVVHVKVLWRKFPACSLYVCVHACMQACLKLRT